MKSSQNYSDPFTHQHMRETLSARVISRSLPRNILTKSWLMSGELFLSKHSDVLQQMAVLPQEKRRLPALQIDLDEKIGETRLLGMEERKTRQMMIPAKMSGNQLIYYR